MEKAMPTTEEAQLEAGSIKGNDQQIGVFENVELNQERFNVWSTIGMAFSCSAAPLAVCSFTYLVTGVGGSSYFFWCYLVAAIGQLLVTASLAEISAVLPHASGQVFWTGSLAPPKFAHFLSYIVGALTFYGWTLGVAGTVVFTGDFFVAFGSLLNESYVAHEWHVYLIAVANTILAMAFNTIGIKTLPYLNKAMIIFLNTAALYIWLVLLAKAPKASAYDALIKVVNETGWTSDGLVFLLGFLPGLLTVCLPDAAAHMAEEVPNPDRTVPLVMFATAMLNACAGFVMIIALVFCTKYPEHLLDPLAGMPIFQIAKDAWDNHGWVITVAIIQLVVPLNGAVSIMTGGSRLLWAFAKYGGIVGARSIGYTSPKLQTPNNAIIATGILTMLISLLVFGPTTVLNGIFGSSGICMSVSFVFPIFFMLVRGRKDLPQRRYFNLGKFGPVINIISLCWLILVTLMLSFPIYQPVTTSSMNWASVVFFGLLATALVNWVFVRKTYQIPKPFFVEGLHGAVNRQE